MGRKVKPDDRTFVAILGALALLVAFALGWWQAVAIVSGFALLWAAAWYLGVAVINLGITQGIEKGLRKLLDE